MAGCKEHRPPTTNEPPHINNNCATDTTTVQTPEKDSTNDNYQKNDPHKKKDGTPTCENQQIQGLIY